MVFRAELRDGFDDGRLSGSTPARVVEISVSTTDRGMLLPWSAASSVVSYDRERA